MNEVEALTKQARTAGEFAQGYFRYLAEVLGEIDPASIDGVAEELLAARRAGATVFVAGNGGSAATASSMANDLGFDVVKKSGTATPFRILALTDNTPVLSAIANDTTFDNIFVSQLAIHYRPGDRLIVISASGNSSNVVAAAEWVKARGGRVVGLLGFDGGRLRVLCDVVVHVPTNAGEYGPVEDAHLVLNHVLAHWFQFTLDARGAGGR